MAAGSTTVSTPIVATVQPLQANGTLTPGSVVKSVNWAIADNSIATFSVDFTTFACTFSPVKTGTTVVTATATIVDADGVTVVLDGTGTLTVTAGANDARTVSIDIVFSPAPTA